MEGKIVTDSKESVIVTKEEPLVISKPSVEYDTITIKPGGHIVYQGNVTLRVNQLIKE